LGFCMVLEGYREKLNGHSVQNSLFWLTLFCIVYAL
jgi:hypothetical protein